MANANKVHKNIVRMVNASRTGRIEAKTISELKKAVEAQDMRNSCFQQLLANMKHDKKLRGFSLQGSLYIQA